MRLPFIFTVLFSGSLVASGVVWANPPAAKSGAVHGAGVSTEVSSPEEAIRLEIARQVEDLTKRIKEGTPQFSMNGTLEVSSDGRYMVNGEPFLINSETQILGQIKAGQMVEVRGYLKPGQPKVAFRLVFYEHKEPLKSKSESVQVTNMR